MVLAVFRFTFGRPKVNPGAWGRVAPTRPEPRSSGARSPHKTPGVWGPQAPTGFDKKQCRSARRAEEYWKVMCKNGSESNEACIHHQSHRREAGRHGGADGDGPRASRPATAWRWSASSPSGRATPPRPPAPWPRPGRTCGSTPAAATAPSTRWPTGSSASPTPPWTCVPVGTGNDFLKNFGDAAPLFSDPENLFDGPQFPLDAIECNGRRL